MVAGAVHADLNGDGIPDAIFSNVSEADRLCLGDGAGGFSSCSDISADTFQSTNVALGDVDGDGDLDAVFANFGTSNRVCTNDGSGGFTCADVSPDILETMGVLLGDVDGDNDLDAVFVNAFARRNRVCTNDGTGSFTCADVGPGTFTSFGGALGDVDGDGDLDAVFANQQDFKPASTRLCTNDGGGAFTCADLAAASSDGTGVALGDVDGDSDLDAVISRQSALQNQLCTNDGSGSFSCTTVSADTFDSQSVALGDVDDDNDLDAVFANENQPNRICTNDGTGSFACTDVSADLGFWEDVMLGDLDGDGDLDAVFSNRNGTNRACTNDGTGTFTCSDESAGGFQSWGVALSTGTAAAPTGPQLSIAGNVPAAENDTVDVDVEFTSGGAQIVATAFSLDYDQTCLFFDDIDFNPADGIPDNLAIQVPDDFDVTVFHDLGDTDGEIDVLLSDLSSPLTSLSDGPVITVTFQATCSPALGTTTLAPVGFSAEPAASFSDELATDVAGTTVDGAVEIFPGPRGDCNGNGSLSVADIVAEGLEIFDGDGTFWGGAPGGTFAGSPVGCDANDDETINAADVSCTTLLLFGGTCTPAGDLRSPHPPSLLIDGSTPLAAGESRWLPVFFRNGGHALSSLAFSLDLDLSRLRFEARDRDGDGLPDGVRFPAGAPSLATVRFDRSDHDGELDVLLADLGGAPLSTGVVLEILLEAGGATTSPQASKEHRAAAGVEFSNAPRASFGSVTGQAVPGRATVVFSQPMR